VLPFDFCWEYKLWRYVGILKKSLARAKRGSKRPVLPFPETGNLHQRFDPFADYFISSQEIIVFIDGHGHSLNRLIRDTLSSGA
jgi:hypothetical protein